MFWDWIIFVGSVLPGFFWGIVIGNLMHGVPIDAQGNYAGTFLTPLNPFALLVGLTFDVFFLLHGAIFLSLRENGPLVKRAQNVATRAWFVNLLMIMLVVITGFTMTNVFKEVLLNPRIVPLDYMIGAALVTQLWLNIRGRSGWAFAMSFVVVLLSGAVVLLCLFPDVMVSSLHASLESNYQELKCKFLLNGSHKLDRPDHPSLCDILSSMELLGLPKKDRAPHHRPLLIQPMVRAALTTPTVRARFIAPVCSHPRTGSFQINKVNTMNINKKLLHYVKTMYLYIVIVGILGLLTALCIVAQAHFIALIINGAFLLKQSLPILQGAFTILLIVLLIRALLIWGGEVITNAVSCRVKSDLRGRLFSYLFKLGPLYTRGERSGEIVNTSADGVETLNAYFIQFFPQLTTTLIIPGVVLIAVFKFDLLSGIILLLTWPILPIFMILIGMQANAMTKKRWQLLSQLSAHFLDVLQGLTTLKFFGRATVQEETIRRVSEQYGAITMKVLRVAFLSSFVMEIGATLSTAIVAVEIGLRLLYGGIPFASALFILLLAPEFYLPLRSLGTQFHASMDSAASAERIFDILETPLPETLITGVGAAPDVRPRADEPSRRETGARQVPPLHALAFQDVHYSYPTTDDRQTTKEALQGISFTVQPGQRVAFVGASGAGKTTIASLLLRFMEPTSGTITIDDRPIQQLTAQEWRKMVAWQPQHPYVFNTTIAENIRLGRADAPIGRCNKGGTGSRHT